MAAGSLAIGSDNSMHCEFVSGESGHAAAELTAYHQAVPSRLQRSNLKIHTAHLQSTLIPVGGEAQNVQQLCSNSSEGEQYTAAMIAATVPLAPQRDLMGYGYGLHNQHLSSHPHCQHSSVDQQHQVNTTSLDSNLQHQLKHTAARQLLQALAQLQRLRHRRHRQLQQQQLPLHLQPQWQRPRSRFAAAARNAAAHSDFMQAASGHSTAVSDGNCTPGSSSPNPLACTEELADVARGLPVLPASRVKLPQRDTLRRQAAFRASQLTAAAADAGQADTIVSTTASGRLDAAAGASSQVGHSTEHSPICSKDKGRDNSNYSACQLAPQIGPLRQTTALHGLQGLLSRQPNRHNPISTQGGMCGKQAAFAQRRPVKRTLQETNYCTVPKPPHTGALQAVSMGRVLQGTPDSVVGSKSGEGSNSSRCAAVSAVQAAAASNSSAMLVDTVQPGSMNVTSLALEQQQPLNSQQQGSPAATGRTIASNSSKSMMLGTKCHEGIGRLASHKLGPGCFAWPSQPSNRPAVGSRQGQALNQAAHPSAVPPSSDNARNMAWQSTAFHQLTHSNGSSSEVVAGANNPCSSSTLLSQSFLANQRGSIEAADSSPFSEQKWQQQRPKCGLRRCQPGITSLLPSGSSNNAALTLFSTRAR